MITQQQLLELQEAVIVIDRVLQKFETEFPKMRGEITALLEGKLVKLSEETFARINAQAPELLAAVNKMQAAATAELIASVDSLKTSLPRLISEVQGNVSREVTKLAREEAKQAQEGLGALRVEMEAQIALAVSESALAPMIESITGKRFTSYRDELKAALRKELGAFIADKKQFAAGPDAGGDWPARFKGEWKPETTYKRGDLFTFRGSTFLVLKDSLGLRPLKKEMSGSEPRYALLAAAGAPGSATAGSSSPGAGSGDALVANTLDQFADVTQTAGKTLAITDSTTLAGGTHSGTNTGDNAANSTYSNVTNDAQTKAAIVPNTAPAAGEVLIGNGTAYEKKAISGDGTLASTGALTVNTLVGDSGSGGTKGLVPAPAAGDATKYLKGDGTWATPAGGGSVATDAIFDAAGDLVQGTGANTAARLPLGTAGQVLTVNAGATAAEWAAGGSGSVANPTGTIGLTAVNGVATSAIRSDGAPALSQAIVPTWTGVHTHTPVIAANTSADGIVLENSVAATSGNQSYSPRLRLSGRGWKTNATAASQSVDAKIELVPVQGAANPTAYTDISMSVNGGSYITALRLNHSTHGLFMTCPSDQGLTIGTIGYTTTNTTNDSIVIGRGASGYSCGLFIGRDAQAIGNSAWNTAVGMYATAGNMGTAFGFKSSAGTCAVAIGNEAIADANEFVSGSGIGGQPINNVYFGKGKTNATATAYTINGTGGSGADNAGANLILAGGKSTGSATPGNVVIQTSTAGASSSTAQTLATRATFSPAGAAIIGGITADGSTQGIGYTTNAGGTVTQTTNRSTGVTLSKVCGNIQTDTTSLAAGASASFTVTNTAVAINDVIILSIRSGQTNRETSCEVTAVAAGSFDITVFNQHASTAEVGAIVINFAVIKAVVS